MLKFLTRSSKPEQRTWQEERLDEMPTELEQREAEAHQDIVLVKEALKNSTNQKSIRTIIQRYIHEKIASLNVTIQLLEQLTIPETRQSDKMEALSRLTELRSRMQSLCMCAIDEND